MLKPIEFHLPVVTSTNDYAKELLATYPYVLVSALHQTAGRGRKSREWIGDYGTNVYMSIANKHNHSLSQEDLSAYMWRGALAVIQTLRKTSDSVSFRIKYPNDVQANADGVWSKISGILVEHEFHGSVCVNTVVGIGVNIDQTIFPENIGQPCTSLKCLGLNVTSQAILTDIRDAYVSMASQPWSAIHTRWIDELHLMGAEVVIDNSSEAWQVLRITTDGRLIVRNLVTQTERTVTDGDTVRYKD